MELTPWFPADIKPVRDGWYETGFRDNFLKEFYYWGGDFWRYEKSRHGRLCMFQDRQWRGLARKP